MKRERGETDIEDLNVVTVVHLNQQYFQATILCRVPPGWDCTNRFRNAYVVKDVKKDYVCIVPREMIRDKAFSFEPRVLRSNNIGRRITFTARDDGRKLGGIFLQELPGNWVFFKVDEPYYQESDPNNWWTGFGVRKKDAICF
jgi:hypothetical protein